MEQQLPSSEIFFSQAKDILEFIANCNRNIKLLQEAGNSPGSAIIRQEKHLKHKLCLELNELFSSYEYDIEVVEIEQMYSKAA